MARKKIPDNKKRIKIGASIDPDVNKKLEEYMKNNDIHNKSKFIETLIINEINK